MEETGRQVWRGDDASSKDHVRLVMGWKDLGATGGIRRNEAGFGSIKSLAEKATGDEPLVINAFLYAFLCPAKNFDLFLNENVNAIADDVRTIEEKMSRLEHFERNGRLGSSPILRRLYLDARSIAARRNARDEQRTLATLLFSGPSTAAQISSDLGISENLADRTLRVLGAVVEVTTGTEPDKTLFALRTDTDVLAAVLYLLRTTIGLDPLPVLQRRIAARHRGAST